MPGAVLKESLIGTVAGLREEGAAEVVLQAAGEMSDDSLGDEYEGLHVGGTAMLLRGPSARSKEDVAWQALSGTVVPTFHGAAFVVDDDKPTSATASAFGGEGADSQTTASPTLPVPDPAVRMIMVSTWRACRDGTWSRG